MKKVKSITPAQKNALGFIVTYIGQHGYSPTLQDIATGLGKSLTTAQHYVDTLEKNNYLRKAKNKTRGILPTTGTSPTVMKMGFIAAGEPIEALENPTPVLVPKEFLEKPGQYYALEVKGDSMIDDGVWDGDLIVVRHQFTANPSDTIVAITDTGATLKVLKYDNSGRAYLQPRNDKYEKIYPDSLEIRGKLVGVIHYEI